MNNKESSNIIAFDSYNDCEDYDDVKVSVSIKSLFTLMITEVLHKAKNPLTINNIMKHMRFMYGRQMPPEIEAEQ